MQRGLILVKTLFDEIGKERGHRVDRDFFLFVQMCFVTTDKWVSTS